MNGAKKMLSFDREDMTELERKLFLKDFAAVAEEYFETDGEPELKTERSENGFKMTITFSVRRIKAVKRPI